MKREPDPSHGPKARSFIAALESLCRERGVRLSVSGYDGLQVWDLKTGEDEIYCAGIDDETSDSIGDQVK